MADLNTIKQAAALAKTDPSGAYDLLDKTAATGKWDDVLVKAQDKFLAEMMQELKAKIGKSLRHFGRPTSGLVYFETEIEGVTYSVETGFKSKYDELFFIDSKKLGARRMFSAFGHTPKSLASQIVFFMEEA